jgi:tetratricopeptide (TPR) repeat protein
MSSEQLATRIRSRFEAADHVRRGVCLLNAGRYDEAAAEFAVASELGSADQSLPAYLAACLIGKGDPSAAADRFADADAQRGGGTVHAIREALALREAGRKADATNVLRSAIRDNAENPELHFQLGILLAESERFEEAELRFTQVLSITRDHAEALLNLALCCGARSVPGEAVQHLLRAQALRPHDARIGLLLTQAAKAARQQGLAVRVRAAVSEDDPVVDPHGIEELARIVEIEPDFVDAFLSIPLGTIDERVFAMLARTLEVALERQPEHAELHYHCARLLDRLGRREDAIAENERAVQIDPTFVRALIELGRLYQQTDRAKDATTRLEQAIRAGAEYADVYFLLGNVYRDQGNLLRARSAYRRALALNERYEAAQQALAALPV